VPILQSQTRRLPDPPYKDRGPELQAWLTQFGCHHTSKGGNNMGGLDKISGNCSRIKPSQKHIWGVNPFFIT
jgi:hypothetical protein